MKISSKDIKEGNIWFLFLAYKHTQYRAKTIYYFPFSFL